MEIFEGKKMTDVTLTGVSSNSQPNDESCAVLKPSLEETVVTTTVESVVETVVETTEVSVVKMVQEDKEDEVMKNVEKGEGGEGMESVNEGLFGNLVGGGDDEGVLMVSVTPETDHENGGGGGVEEETMSPRQRKKSKYLSPPYLSPVGGGRLSVFGSGSGSFKEPKPESEPEKVPEMAAKPFEDSLKKSSGKKTRQNKGVREGSDSQEEPKSTAGAAVNVKKVLHGLLRVALDPTSFTEKNLPAVTDFVSSYRSSIFKEGSSHQTDQSTLKEGSSHQTDQKKKARGTSDVAFIKEKLESMMEIVQGCVETEMSADVKASLEGGIQEVLQKVGKLKGK
ncbi:hypothetical protein Hdeb2414_s0251g00847961 [Helianthus debilis subsp. tardiflorus]